MCTRMPLLLAQLILLLMSSIVMSRTVQSSSLQSSDLYRLRAVGEVKFSHDDKYIAYSVESNDRPGRPYSQLWIMDVSTQKSIRLGGEKEVTSGAEWSPDGQWIAYHGGQDDQTGLMVAHADGSAATLLVPVRSTNSPLPMTGKELAWSPDSKRIAFISATPGPETEEANGDPMVITRYLYKPTDSEGLSHFNDNRRLHIFVADVRTKQVRQLTNGVFYEHSIDWSPNGEELLFVSNRETNADQFFNYDIFALRIADNTIRRLTATENAEYRPKWSPDGKAIVYQATKRGLTDLETTMEDTHVWLMQADGSNRRELTPTIDNRQGTPGWAPDGLGLGIYFTVQEHGNVRLYRLPISGGQPEMIVNERGAVGSWSVSRTGTVAYSFHTPRDLPQLYLKTKTATARLTDLNAAVLGNKQIADVDGFTFISNDNKYEVEAFLTKPLEMTAGSRHPLIVNIHGGPHGQNGPAFSFKSQVYAARGWATLMVNYRGSTGYGQAFSDAVFGDQNGNEAQDVLYGASAALRRYLWLDRDRMGIEGVSYGGQLTDWIITQTSQFKAAIPIAGISNLISYNYMTYYNQY